MTDRIQDLDDYPGILERNEILDKILIEDQYSGELAGEQHSPESRNGTVGRNQEARSAGEKKLLDALVHNAIISAQPTEMKKSKSWKKQAKAKLLDGPSRDRRE